MRYLIFFTALITVQQVTAQQEPNQYEQQITNLSKSKWQWMANKNVDSLATLFHEKSMFVHMGGS